MTALLWHYKDSNCSSSSGMAQWLNKSFAFMFGLQIYVFVEVWEFQMQEISARQHLYEWPLPDSSRIHRHRWRLLLEQLMKGRRIDFKFAIVRWWMLFGPTCSVDQQSSIVICRVAFLIYGIQDSATKVFLCQISMPISTHTPKIQTPQSHLFIKTLKLHKLKTPHQISSPHSLVVFCFISFIPPNS